MRNGYCFIVSPVRSTGGGRLAAINCSEDCCEWCPSIKEPVRSTVLDMFEPREWANCISPERTLRRA